MTRPTFCRGTGRQARKCDCLRCSTEPSTIRLTVIHRTDNAGNPIADIEGLPRLGATLTPQQMRQLARQLNQIANDADQGATGTIQYPAEDDSFQPWRDAPAVDFLRLTLGQHRAARAALRSTEPAAQAGQVPEVLRKALGLVVAALEADGDRVTSVTALRELRKALAAAQAQGGSDA
ncbi:MAG: hypothetical protein GAK45_01440 [Pseudomonas citronellolis]|nr:MAG: hypothetical protein GAK45_01440 [Pseudomonas citronellolis]